MTELTIDRLGHRGDGVAPGPVFVARALPGEVVAGEVADGRIAAPRILTPSPDRVAAPCPHYRACGGCALMHARDDFVTGWKEDAVRAALAAHGLAAPFAPIHTSPPGARRRATLAGRRTKSGATVGFHGRASATLVAVPECRVMTDGLRAVLPVLEALTRLGGSRKGEIAFAVTDSESGADIAATGGKPLDADLRVALAATVAEALVARLTWDGEPVAMAAPPRVMLGDVAVTPPPGGFLQATADGEAALRAMVMETVAGAGRVADVFAGCGTFALPLTARAEVHAAEADPDAVAAMAAGWRAAGGRKALRAEVRNLFRDPVPAATLDRFDAVVIDPPRAGAAAQCAEIARSRVPRVAAVSCNPATFARDAATLVAGGYRLDGVRVVDQFRWSAHVEIAARFRRP